MTPAVTQLRKLNISHNIHQYLHEPLAPSFGLEAVDKLGVAAELVFKTLVVEVEQGSLAVAIVPVVSKLSLKKLAKVLNEKKVKMADADKVQNSTGYVLGGVSPLGQKRSLLTIIDTSAEHLNTLFVSGGKRGLELELNPSDLASILTARFADISG